MQQSIKISVLFPFWILVSTFQLNAQSEKSFGVYYDLSVTNGLNYLSNSSIRNFAVKAIERNKPERFKRIFENEGPMLVRIIILVDSAQNKAGRETGFYYSIYLLISQYPETNLDALFFDNMVMGVGGKFEAGEAIQDHLNGAVANLFGQMDPYLGSIYTVLERGEN